MLLVLWPLPATAYCTQMWDTAKVAQDGKTVLTGIPVEWFRGMDIVRKKIDRQSGISTTLYLCQADEPNAFAWRQWGRQMTAVTTGMYFLLGNDWHAYAAIVGHENAHLVLNHMLQRQVRGAALTALTNATGIPAIGAEAFGATFNRDEEFAADKYGLHYALCAGFSPGGAIRLHDKLDSVSHFLHGHPSSKSRIRALQFAAKSHALTRKCR